MRRLRPTLGIAAAALAGCGGEVAPQLLRAEIMSESFPSAVVELRALGAGGVVASAPYRDGETSVLAVPPGDGYQLALLTADRRALLIEDPDGSALFSVCVATEPFELGRVEHACRVHVECEEKRSDLAFCQAQSFSDCDEMRQVLGQCYEDLESMCHELFESYSQCEELMGPDECEAPRSHWEQCQESCIEIEQGVLIACDERCSPLWEVAMSVCEAPPSTCPQTQSHGALPVGLPADFGCEAS